MSDISAGLTVSLFGKPLHDTVKKRSVTQFSGTIQPVSVSLETPLTKDVNSHSEAQRRRMLRVGLCMYWVMTYRTF